MNPIRLLISDHPDLTDQQIAELNNAQPRRTASPIPLDALGPLLRKLGIMAVLNGIVATPTEDPQGKLLQAGLADFLDQLRDVRQRNLDTTDDVIAARAAAMLAALAPIVQQQLRIDPDMVILSVYALGGGIANPVVSVEDVTVVRSAMLREARATVLERQVAAGHESARTLVDAMREGGAEPTKAALVAAFAAEISE